MSNNPFERTETITRIMTADEARAKCVSMGLTDAVTKHVVTQFEARNAAQDDHNERCACFPGSRDPGECEFIQSGHADGRMAYGQSWEYSLEDMARVMGVDEDAFQVDPDAFPQVRSTWDAFFCE